MPPRLLAKIYRDTAGMLGELGRYEQALSLVQRGLDALDDSDAPDLETELLVMKGSVLGALGRLDEAMASIQLAMDRPLATARQRIMRRNNLAMILKWQGELERALPEFEAVYEEARETGLEQLIVYGLLELGDVERLLGDLPAARRHLNEALRRAEAAGEDRWLLFAHRYLAELAAAEDDEGTAELHRDTVQRIQTEMQDDAMANRARVLEISLEVLEREKEVQQLQMDRELQQAQLERGRTLMLLGAAVAGLLLVALWLAVQKSRVRASANRELDRLANTDDLTGLHNRRFFVDHMRRRMADGAAHGALILIDIDQFKRVNDDHGHDHGDAVLKAVADRIQAMMRAEDVLARWGGEEFLAFLPNCDEQSARRVAERIRSAVNDPPVEHNGVARPVTATLGVAALASGQDLDEAFRRADTALYRGKSEGRNCVRFADEAAA
jgi:diguanylate cyclase (GGDEF)-like protein